MSTTTSDPYDAFSLSIAPRRRLSDMRLLVKHDQTKHAWSNAALPLMTLHLRPPPNPADPTIALSGTVPAAQLDNQMLHGDLPGATLKLCDFGFSKNSDLQSTCKSMCGTPEYMAPEVLFEQQVRLGAFLVKQGCIGLREQPEAWLLVISAVTGQL